MKSIILACLLMAAFLSGCANPSEPQKEGESAEPTVESFDIRHELHLQDHQEYEIFDYCDDIVLVLISDASKQNPMDINDQVNTTFYEEFVLFDLSSKTEESYPIQRFGICPSALSAFDGVVFSFFEVSPEQTLRSSIYFVDDSGIRSIYEGDFSPFGMGPALRRYDNAVLFSYLNETGDEFGVTKITETFASEPVLLFSTKEFDYISDDFRASDGSYGYTIGEESKVTFCVGTSDGKTNRIALPEGRKIHGFDVTKDKLFVALAADETDLTITSGIQVFDLKTGQLIFEQTDQVPWLYAISANEYGQICGFSNSMLKMYTLQDQLEEYEVDFTDISGSFFKILSDEDDFLVATYGFNKSPEFWIVSFESAVKEDKAAVTE